MYSIVLHLTSIDWLPMKISLSQRDDETSTVTYAETNTMERIISSWWISVIRSGITIDANNSEISIKIIEANIGLRSQVHVIFLADSCFWAHLLFDELNLNRNLWIVAAFVLYSNKIYDQLKTIDMNEMQLSNYDAWVFFCFCTTELSFIHVDSTESKQDKNRR